MTEPDYVIDPHGEVVICLRNANAPFAVWEEKTIPTPPASPLPDDAPFTECCKRPTEHLDESGYETSELSERHGRTNIDPPSQKLARLSLKDDQNKTRDRESQGPRNGIQFRVSRKHLTSASPWFARALTGGWTESTRSTILADGWDVDAFLLLMNIIHCRLGDLPLSIDLELVAKVAVLADYYECESIVRFFADMWLTPLEKHFPKTYSRDLGLWLWISWFFRLSDKFTRSSLIIINQSTGVIRSIYGLPIPAPVLEQMNHRRSQAIGTIMSSLDQLQSELLRDETGCNFHCRAMLLGTLTKNLYSNGLTPAPVSPYLGLSREGLMKTLRSFTSPAVDRRRSGCNRHEFMLDDSQSIPNHPCQDTGFRDIFSGWNSSVGGLSLEIQGIQECTSRGRQTWV